MYMIHRALLLVAMVSALSACVVTNASRLGTTTESRPLVLPQDVALYRVASQVPRRYEEVALLNSTGDSNYTNESKMFESMKKEAGKVGANAVILDAVSEPSGGAKVAAAIFGVSAQRKGKAVAIWVFPAEQGGVASTQAAAVPPAVAPAPTATPQVLDAEIRPFNYQGKSAEAAKLELARYQCYENFNLVSESGGRAVYEATCRGGKRQLLECVSGACRTLN